MLLKEINFDLYLLTPLPHWGPLPGENLWSPREKLAQKTCAECPQQRYVTGETSKLQGRDRVGIVEGSCRYRAARGVSIREKFVCCPLCSTGSRYAGEFILLRPREKIGTRDLCRVPRAAVLYGRARQISGTGPCGDCGRGLWVPGPRGPYSGKIRFIEKPGVQDEGVGHVAKRFSEPVQPTPKLDFRYGT